MPGASPPRRPPRACARRSRSDGCRRRCRGRCRTTPGATPAAGGAGLVQVGDHLGQQLVEAGDLCREGRVRLRPDVGDHREDGHTDAGVRPAGLGDEGAYVLRGLFRVRVEAQVDQAQRDQEHIRPVRAHGLTDQRGHVQPALAPAGQVGPREVGIGVRVRRRGVRRLVVQRLARAHEGEGAGVGVAQVLPHPVPPGVLTRASDRHRVTDRHESEHPLMMDHQRPG